MSASRTLRSDGRRAPATLRDVVAAYVGLTKPRVIELLLLTTVPVMFFAARGVPPLGLVVATVVGGTLSAGSASALNCVYDRDIDEQMRRTRRRALPRHIVSPRGGAGLRPRARRRLDGGALASGSTGSRPALSLLAERVLRLRLHDAAQAPHHAEHRLGRPRRLLPGADRLDRGHRRARLGAGRAVRWSSSSGRRRTPGRWRCATARTTRASTCRCCPWSRRPPRWAARSSLYSWVMVATSLLLWPVADTGLVLPGRRGRARRGLPGRGAPDVAARRAAPRTSR